VGRLAASADALYATCMDRSPRDDETAPADWLWEGSPPLSLRRLYGGALVALSPALEVRFRLDLDALGLFPGDRAPVPLLNGRRVALAAGKTRSESGWRAVDSGAIVLFIEAGSGDIVARQEVEGGFRDAVPCLNGEGLLAGTSLLDAQSEAVVRRFELSAADLEPIAPVAQDGVALLAGARGLFSLDLQTGHLSPSGDYGLPERARVTTPLVATTDSAYLGIDTGGNARLVAVRLR
jgi:hypothetical protein